MGKEQQIGEDYNITIIIVSLSDTPIGADTNLWNRLLIGHDRTYILQSFSQKMQNISVFLLSFVVIVDLVLSSTAYHVAWLLNLQ